MSDFENVLIHVPYEVDVFYSEERRRLRVDAAFEVPVATFSRADARLVATVCSYLLEEGDGPIKFLDLDERLFRPYLEHERRSLWTPERCRGEPPIMRLDDAWNPAPGW